MSSMIRTFARKMAREGKEIRVVKGVRQYAKVRPSKQEFEQARHQKEIDLKKEAVKSLKTKKGIK